MNDYTTHINEEIKNGNPWYTDSHFEWSERESIRRIYDQRLIYFYNILKNKISSKGHVTLLDYGCGDGYWSLIFSRFSQCDVTGVDYNKLRLARCRDLMPNIKFIEADLSKSASNLEKYDIVFCSQVIEHIEDDVQFISNIKNHLKDDGVLILGTTNEGCLTQNIRNRLKKSTSDHVHFYKEKEIRDKITMAGFKLNSVYREVFYPGSDVLYYKLTSTDLGFKLLELLTILIPSQCSDYYFICEKLLINRNQY